MGLVKTQSESEAYMGIFVASRGIILDQMEVVSENL